MHIIFIPSEIAQDKKLNETIVSFCTSQGHKVFDATIDEKSTPDDVKKKINDLIAEIKQTDAIIFEVTQPSFNQGRYLTLALQNHKSILLLYRDNLSSEFVSTEQSRLISTYEYQKNDTISLENGIKEFIKLVKKQRLLYRFNLMISKDLNSYLMDKSREQGVSKADYLRNLIVQDMDPTS